MDDREERLLPGRTRDRRARTLRAPVLLGALWLLGAAPSGAQAPSAEVPVPQALGGAMDAPIKIEVFSDFECPSCRTLYLDTTRQVLKEYCSKDKVCVIYHEFPLPMHAHAREAARYSQAARRLGLKTWLAVIDAIYTHQAEWSKTGAVGPVVSKALTPEEFQKVTKLLQDPSINAEIDRTVAEGQKRGVKSTPTLFVSAIGKEQPFAGVIPYPVLKEFFDRIVK